MIRPCAPADFAAVLAVVNDGAQSYRGVIPADRWHEPYMDADELRREIAAGVHFQGWFEDGRLAGVMGLQAVQDVALIRHAYVDSAHQGRGIGSGLLDHLASRAQAPLLVGTWAAAKRSIAFYEARGFLLVEGGERDRLLRRYWTIPEPQIDASVVLRRSA